jgi:hypothetical protein
MATEMFWVSLEEPSRTNSPRKRFHSKLFCKIVRYSCRTLYIYHWGAGLAVTRRIRDIGQNVLQPSFQTIRSSSPQLLPHFLAYRVPREGIYLKYNYNIHYLNNIITICINNNAIILYTNIYICLFVCLFVCMYGTYTNSNFWTDLNQTLHTSPSRSGRDRRVCMDPKFLTSSTFWNFFLWRPLQNHGHKMAAGATVFRDALISVIPAGVLVTSQTAESSAAALYPWLQRAFP